MGKYTSNPLAPDKAQALHAAEKIARALRAEIPEYHVRIDESIKNRFHVVVEVPYRMEHLTREEREKAKTDG